MVAPIHFANEKEARVELASSNFDLGFSHELKSFLRFQWLQSFGMV